MVTKNPLISSLQTQRNSALDAVAELNAKLVDAAAIIGKLEKEKQELIDKVSTLENKPGESE